MPAKPLSDDLALEAAAAYRRMGLDGWQMLVGVSPKAFETRVTVAVSRGFVTRAERRSMSQDSVPRVMADEIQVKPPPPVDEPLEDLIERKKAGMDRALAGKAWSKLIPVKVKCSGAIAVTLVGDPHIDDDGCDIAQLEVDLTTVGRNKGMFALHIGDLTNNWVGRLARLYANQSTTFQDGIRLTEWMLGLCPNLAVVGGNHNLWNNGMDLLRFIVRQGALQPHGARLGLMFPNGKEIRLHARHDFPGRSQYSATHGMKRELLFGFRDHVKCAGHIHTDEARFEPPIGGEDDPHWMFRLSGYKRIDDYADERNYHERRLAPATTLIINPDPTKPAELIKPFWCVETAADYLKFLNARQ